MTTAVEATRLRTSLGSGPTMLATKDRVRLLVDAQLTRKGFVWCSVHAREVVGATL